MIHSFRSIQQLLIVLLIACAPAGAHEYPTDHRAAQKHVAPVISYPDAPQTLSAQESAKEILESIRKNISENNLEALSPYFSSKVYISLLNGKEGYFSSEQSHFILKNFFINYTPVSFLYSNSNHQNENPYGVGTLHYTNRGQRGKAQLYISLTRVKNNWRINQITITNR